MGALLMETQSRDRLQQLSQDVLALAKNLGASQAEVAISQSQGFSVNVRMGEVETIEHNRDKSLMITIYHGHRTGSASTADFSREAIEASVRAASSIARYTAEDEFSGLADKDRLATEFPDLELYHPWTIDVGLAINLATRCEAHARNSDARIQNSEGASVSTHTGGEVYANSHGFIGYSEASRHSISCAVVGQQDGAMQRDYWYSSARDPETLQDVDEVGRIAAARTVRRLGAKRIPTRQCPVIYEAPVASSLLSHFISAIRGGSLYRKASFLLDHLDQPVFSAGIHIFEQPHLLRAMGSAVYDNEGVATRNRDLVIDGVLKSYVLDSYSARKLNLQTTGNAGGVRNLILESGEHDFEALLKQMHTGLLITELIGHGTNLVTGDYSRGAAGFWVEGGEIQYPVEEVTVAGNLKDIFQHVVAVGSDVDTRGNTRTGSILIENMTVAGS